MRYHFKNHFTKKLLKLIIRVHNLSGYLHKIAIAIAVLLIILGALMLLGWTSHLLSKVQNIIDKYQTNEDSDEVFTPRRNMYLWGIGYSAASVDCTAAAVFPFIGWLAVVGSDAFASAAAPAGGRARRLSRSLWGVDDVGMIS